jgi:aminocarboxymuconate-semialdehyde decarboxylase
LPHLFTCGHPHHAPQTDGGAVLRRSGSSKVVDIHCHLGSPAADALMRPHLKPEHNLLARFSSPASDRTNAEAFGRMGRKLNTVDERLADMDRMGVDIQVVSPSPGQYFYWAEPELGRQAAQLVNNSIAEACAQHPDRLKPLGTVPLQNAEMAVAELRRCMGELGMRGVEISSNIDGREISMPELEPFYAAAEEMGALIFLHPLGFTHADRMSEHYFNNIIGNPLESALAVGHLIFDGVLDRHPGLKICVAHGGGYLPTYSGRMDHAFRARADARQHITREPSTYLRQLWFDSLVFDKDHLGWLIDKFGADRILLGTDYPFDMSEGDPVGFTAALPDGVREKVRGANALDLLGLLADA